MRMKNPRDSGSILNSLSPELQSLVAKLINWPLMCRWFCSVGTDFGQGITMRPYKVVVEEIHRDMFYPQTNCPTDEEIAKELALHGFVRILRGRLYPKSFWCLDPERLAALEKCRLLEVGVLAMVQQAIAANPTVEIKACDGKSNKCTARVRVHHCPGRPHVVLNFCRECIYTIEKEECLHETLRDDLLGYGFGYIPETKGQNPGLCRGWWIYPHLNEQRIEVQAVKKRQSKHLAEVRA